MGEERFPARILSALLGKIIHVRQAFVKPTQAGLFTGPRVCFDIEIDSKEEV